MEAIERITFLKVVKGILTEVLSCSFFKSHSRMRWDTFQLMGLFFLAWFTNPAQVRTNPAQIQHKSDLTCWNFFANNKYLIRLVFANLLGWVYWTILCFFEGHDTYKYTYYTQIWIQSYTFYTWFITSISLIVTVLEFSVDIREGMYYINRQTHKTKEADSQHFCQFVFFRFWNIIGPAAIKLSSW